jgi:serine-type D-Ala-D-Ala carboxypeptidase/endopeptidase (penicillin-binding protein 4)
MYFKSFFLITLLLLKLSFGQHFIDKEFKILLNDPELSTAHIGFSLVDTKTQHIAYSYQSSKWFSTASSLKLLTTATALNTLGGNYQFKTEIKHLGNLSNGIIDGNLVVNGSGDPTFASTRFGSSIDIETSKIVEAIKAKKIKEIKGGIVFNCDGFDTNPVSDKTYWLDIGNYFGGAVWPLNIDENIYKVTFSRTIKLGDSTKILSIKPALNVTFKNDVTIGGNSDEAYIFCAPYSNFGFIKGTLPPSTEPYTIKGANPKPMETFAQMIIKKLKDNNIQVKDSISYNFGKPLQGSIIWENKSVNLEEIVKQTNWYSINIFAEALLRACGKARNDKFYNAAGVSTVKKLLDSLKINSNELSMCDGSGISPSNMCTPQLMTTFLAKIYQKEPWFNMFYSSLSSSGGQGTLSSMGKGTALEGRMKAKSGNMDGISSYSGYVKSKSGKEYSFAIFINNFKADNKTVKKKIEKLLIKIAES